MRAESAIAQLVQAFLFQLLDSNGIPIAELSPADIDLLGLAVPGSGLRFIPVDQAGDDWTDDDEIGLFYGPRPDAAASFPDLRGVAIHGPAVPYGLLGEHARGVIEAMGSAVSELAQTRMTADSEGRGGATVSARYDHDGPGDDHASTAQLVTVPDPFTGGATVEAESRVAGGVEDLNVTIRTFDGSSRVSSLTVDTDATTNRVALHTTGSFLTDESADVELTADPSTGDLRVELIAGASRLRLDSTGRNTDGTLTYERQTGSGYEHVTTMTSAAVTPEPGFNVLNQADEIARITAGTTQFATGQIMIRNETGGTIGNGRKLGTVPVGYRPLSTTFIVGNSHNPNVMVRITVFANGDIDAANIDGGVVNDTGIISFAATWQIAD